MDCAMCKQETPANHKATGTRLTHRAQDNHLSGNTLQPLRPGQVVWRAVMSSTALLQAISNAKRPQDIVCLWDLIQEELLVQWDKMLVLLASTSARLPCA